MKRLCNRNIMSESRLQGTKDWIVMLGYPLLCLVSLLLSMCFEIAEKQFIVISLIAGFRWIFVSKETRILIIERG